MHVYIYDSKSHLVVSNSLCFHGLYSLWNSQGQNTRVGSHSLLHGDLPNPGIKPSSLSLRVDSLPAEPQGKPKNTGVDRLSLLQGIFPTQELNQGLLHCRQILYQLATWEVSYMYMCVYIYIYICIYSGHRCFSLPFSLITSEYSQNICMLVHTHTHTKPTAGHY